MQTAIDLKQIEAVIARLSVEDRKELAALAAPLLKQPFLPNPGPQTAALESLADILLYGGQAGGGKSALEVGCAALNHTSSLILRREGTQLDGLIKFSKEILEPYGRFVGGNENVWRLDSGAEIKFAGLNQPDDWRKHAGNARDYLAFDEAGEFLREQVFSLIGWLRSTKEGQRCRVILGSNPPRGGDGEWMIEEFAPWLDPLFPNPAAHGELRWAIVVGGTTEWVPGPGVYERGGEEYEAMSRTFIPASLDDNPYLRDTNYRAKLQALPEPLRSQLLHGDFLAGRIDDPMQVIPTEWVLLAQERWRKTKDGPHAPMSCIGIDVALGGKDTTVYAPLRGARFDELVERPGKETPDPPDVVMGAFEIRRDDALLVVDYSGGWGSGVVSHLKTHHDIKAERFVASAGSGARTKDGSFGFKNLRAEMWWALREAFDPESGTDIAIPPDPRLQAQLTCPRWKPLGDMILIESKDDLRARLGTSTDRADAVGQAWVFRSKALFRRNAKAQARTAAVVESDPLAGW